MPDLARRYTVDEVFALPEDGNRYELIDGALVVNPAPRPRHQAVITALFWHLANYLRPLGRGHTLFAGLADISWDDETLVQPDLLVVPPEEVTNSWTSYRTLLLAVEVVSPSSARTDRIVKRRLYQKRGVHTYWLVDPEAELVEVWHPSDRRPEIVPDTLTWRVSADADPVEIPLADVFQGLPF